MTDWASSLGRTHRRLDQLGWTASAATVAVFLAATTALAMRMSDEIGLENAAEEAILLDLEPMAAAPAVTAMPEAAPEIPNIDAPDAPEPVEEAVTEPDPVTPDMTPPEMPELAELTPPELAPDNFSPPPPPPPEPEKQVEEKPEVKPEPKKEPPKKQAKKADKPREAAAPAAQRAQSAAPAQSGAGQTAVAAGKAANLEKQWGGAIRAKVNKRKPASRGVGGTVTLKLTVQRNGQLAGASVSKSSGNPELDSAALRAAQSSGPFRAAPAELTKASYDFFIPIRFDPPK